MQTYIHSLHSRADNILSACSYKIHIILNTYINTCMYTYVCLYIPIDGIIVN